MSLSRSGNRQASPALSSSGKTSGIRCLIDLLDSDWTRWQNRGENRLIDRVPNPVTQYVLSWPYRIEQGKRGMAKKRSVVECWGQQGK